MKKDGKYPKKSRGSRAVSYYLGCIRAIHNKACLEFNDYDTKTIRIPRQPFRKGSIPPMPVTELREMMAQDEGLSRDWDDRYGDRMQKLVFIGQHLDEKALAEALDACLTV